MTITSTVQNFAATPVTLTIGQIVAGALTIALSVGPLLVWGIRTARRSAVSSAATLAAITRLERTAWTRFDQLGWVAELQKKNRNLDIPIPDAPDTPRPTITRDEDACEA